jgi:hypothetical protein
MAAGTPNSTRLYRDITALVLILAGAAGLVWAAAATDWRALTALLSVYAVAGGILLGRGE